MVGRVDGDSIFGAVQLCVSSRSRILAALSHRQHKAASVPNSAVETSPLEAPSGAKAPFLRCRFRHRHSPTRAPPRPRWYLVSTQKRRLRGSPRVKSLAKQPPLALRMIAALAPSGTKFYATGSQANRRAPPSAMMSACRPALMPRRLLRSPSNGFADIDSLVTEKGHRLSVHRHLKQHLQCRINTQTAVMRAAPPSVV